MVGTAQVGTVDRPFTTLHLDARALRVLAHPLRSRLLTALRTGGPATATALARTLETNSGATSYHLRRLESVGLVEETDEGRGRERWWKASTSAHEWTQRDVAGNPEAEAASDWLRRHYLRSFLDHYEAWLGAGPSWPLDWRAAAESGDTLLHLTPTQLAALHQDVITLLDRYRETAAAEEPQTRPVAVYWHAFPISAAETNEVKTDTPTHDEPVDHEGDTR